MENLPPQNQLSTTCSNLRKKPNGDLLVAIDHNQLRTMASETLDPIEWSQPPTLHRAVPPEIHVLHGVNIGAVNRRCYRICMCRSHQSVANVVGSILHVLGKNTDTAIVGYRWTGVGGHHALYC